jgi:cell division protease FtsH
MRKVDAEVRSIIDAQYSRARQLIEEHSDKMHAMAKALLEWETIDAEQVEDIMQGRPPRPPKETPSSTGGGSDGGGTPAPVTGDSATAAV